MPVIPLSNAALPHLRSPVHVPMRRPTAAGIVHLGLGGFHRAHMARATHDVMQARPDMLGWGIVGAGLMQGDRLMRDSLLPQDCLYTLMERAGGTETVTVIGSLVDVLFAGDDTGALLQALDQPGIRIVSLTVTENGYCLDRATKRLDPAHPSILRDPGPTHPARQRDRHHRRSIPAPYGRRRRPLHRNELRQHRAQRRRVPAPGSAGARDVAGPGPGGVDRREHPVPQHDGGPHHACDVRCRPNGAGRAIRHPEDRWPVVSERFSQWVIEDRFARGRPAWEKAGAQFVADVAPYEFMKLRLLNASHLAVSGLGRLMGYVTIDEAMADPLMTRYMAALMERETGPTLPPVPGIDLAAYKATLIERFANPAIKDTVERVNTDAPLNILLDPIRDRLDRGEAIDLLALALAAWLRRVRGTDERDGAIDVRHPLAAELAARAKQGGEDPGPLLAMTALFGALGQQQALVRPVARWLSALYRDGSRATLAEASRTLAF